MLYEGVAQRSERVISPMTLDERQQPTVILLPGLWMPAWVMLPLARRLRARGHRCITYGYRSARAGLDENSLRLARCVGAVGAARTHLVGHSLGGALALHATVRHRLAQVERIVMVGSPYGDSYTARRLAERDWGRRILGHTVPQWLACEKPAVPAGVEVGVIAGTRACGLGLLVVPDAVRPHDGVIRGSETRVPGMSAYVEVRVSHAGMLLSAQVAQLVDCFFTCGRFATKEADPPPLAGELSRLDRERR